MQEYKEYSKISIHNHFGDEFSERRKDDMYNKSIKFNYISAMNKIKKVYEENFNLLAFTNANILLVTQYIGLKKICGIT